MYKIKISVLICILAFAGAVYADASGTSSVSQSIESGSLNVTAPPGNSALQQVPTGFSPQTTTGVISNLRIDDNRGTAVGWTVSANMQHLTYTKNPQPGQNNSSPLIINNNRYDGTCGVTYPVTTYTITISTGGTIGTARYSVNGGCPGETLQTDVLTTLSNNAVGSRGITIDFPSGTYYVNDKWTIGVDVFPYTDMTIIPQSPTVAEPGSDLTGITPATSGIFTGTSTTSNSRTVLQADSGKGMGSFFQNINLSLIIHPNSYAGSFTGTITFTIL